MKKRLNDWRNVLLAEVAEVRTGVAKSQRIPDNAVRLPYVRVANVQDGHFDLSEVKDIAISADDIDRYSLRRGDVLMTEGGDFDKLGRGHVWTGEIEPCVHQNHVFAVRPKQDLLDPHFLAYFAASPRGREHFIRCAKRSTNLASINSTQLKKTPIPLPPIDEQQRIVSAIQAWENTSSALTELMAAKSSHKNALIDGLLTGQLRFRGFIEKWCESALRDLFVERREVGYDDLPLLAITANDGVVMRSTLGRRDTSPEDKSRYLRVRSGDIVYNTMRMWQGVSGRSSIDGIVSPAYTVCTPTAKIDGRFAARLFKLPSVIHLFYRHSQGLVSDTWNLKFTHFAKIKVSIPDVVEQTRIADVLDTVDNEIRILNSQRVLLEKQKRAVIHKLFTGAIRLNSGA